MRRHILPIIVTPVIDMCAWLVISSPLLFVFIIDDAFKISEFTKFIFTALGIGLIISGLIMFPVIFIFEKIIAKSIVTIAVVPGFMLLVSGFIVWKFMFDRQSIYDIEPWGSRLLFFSFSFVCYWLIFWIPRLKVAPDKMLDVT